MLMTFRRIHGTAAAAGSACSAPAPRHRPHALDQTRDLGERRLLVLGIDRDMEERDAVPLDHAAQVVVVGDHAGNFAIELVGVPAMQQIGQAVGFAAGHQHHAFLLGRVGDPPGHGELFGDRRERLAKRFDAKWQGFGADLMAHEEPTALLIGWWLASLIQPLYRARKLLTFATMPTRSGQAITSR